MNSPLQLCPVVEATGDVISEVFHLLHRLVEEGSLALVR